MEKIEELLKSSTIRRRANLRLVLLTPQIPSSGGKKVAELDSATSEKNLEVPHIPLSKDSKKQDLTPFITVTPFITERSDM